MIILHFMILYLPTAGHAEFYMMNCVNFIAGFYGCVINTSTTFTQNHQCGFAHVQSRSFLHFTLVRSRMLGRELSDRERGIALRGVAHRKVHPLHKRQVAMEIFLST